MSESPLDNNLPNIPNTSSQYSTQDKLNACALYSIHGNAQKVSDLVNIPRRTIAEWTKAEWWDAHIASIRQETRDTTLASLDNIISIGLERTRERVTDGDKVMVRDSEEDAGYRLVDVPMKGKDVATTTAIMIDKRQILLNQPTSIRGDASEGMKALAEQFEKLASKHNRVVSEQ